MRKGTNKLHLSLLLLLCSSLFFAASLQKIPAVDDLADSYFEESIKAASITYASIRGVNAVVSVVKASELDLAPAGVGFTIAAGQILDPVDDMTERLSNVLVAAIASLGIQKIGFEISRILSFKAIAILLLFCIPLLWLQNRFSLLGLQWVLKICVLLLVLRFMLPVSALVSESFYQQVLQPKIESAEDKLSLVSSSYNEMRDIPLEESDGFFSSLTSSASNKVTQTKQAFLQIVEHADAIISSLLSLMTAYLAIFVVQILLLPLLSLWLLLLIFKSSTLDELLLSVIQSVVHPLRSVKANLNQS